MKSKTTIRRHLKTVLKRLGQNNVGPTERLIGDTVGSLLQWVIHKDTYEPISLLIDANIDDYHAGYIGPDNKLTGN